MKTEDIATIVHYDKAFALIEDQLPEELEKLTEDARITLESVDDYEWFEYLVIDGATVIVTEGNAVIMHESLDDFLRHTLDYIRENEVVSV